MNRSAPTGNRASTVLGRRLGGELLRLRDAAGKTQQQAADVLNATNSKIVKMERGWVPMRDIEIRALCELYGLDDPEALARLLNLARLDRERRKAKGWWQHAPQAGARAGGHACMAGAFNIISFAEAQAVDVVHVDSIAATVWVESESESTMYGSFFDRTARLSLAPKDSLRLIESIREGMH
ncbi:helix-turn-helix domain-containing protein [Streptomyces sp. TLI_185]|uniref:helix-turn-helix domain-containing protein n=1 Tax=Streptomyces sp. TLI_185 TaxID=2485151 RepID=UPI0021A2D1FF|nr:helix-turn-helix domain-containing protein [Streptomyces sp. TLI_185]